MKRHTAVGSIYAITTTGENPDGTPLQEQKWYPTIKQATAALKAMPPEAKLWQQDVYTHTQSTPWTLYNP